MPQVYRGLGTWSVNAFEIVYWVFDCLFLIEFLKSVLRKCTLPKYRVSDFGSKPRLLHCLITLQMAASVSFTEKQYYFLTSWECCKNLNN